ncbi:EAL domain-containing protein [Candidatus Thiodiazotropha sp. CDECU1]|uniref:EAL domain-containing protein n=1 Tax=Candidatus Thiodiazotropha sp. CDECU1 TaxID=3065865 RepID=UPI00292E05B9|nr:EAL domain-containing protein [Candidatus Thiodiazotropha sp. CDECU1]
MMSALTLKQIFSTEVETVSADIPIDKVLLRMERNQISCLVAVDENRRPIGIFTEQDAIRIMAERQSVREIRMNDVMSNSPLTAAENMDFHDAYRIMSEKKYRHLLVVDDEGCLSGLVSEADFLHHMGMEYLVELKTVESAMTRHVMSLDPSDTLVKAVRLMAEHQISCVVVCIDGIPEGILTERDIVHLAQSLNQDDEITVGQVMHSPVFTCHAEIPMQEAARMMENKRIRRLVVIRADGNLCGVITRHDIVKALQGRYVEYLHETLVRTSRDLQNTLSNLREAQQKVFLLNLIEQIDDAIYIIESESGRIIEVNDKACEMLGYSRDELCILMVWEISAAIENESSWRREQANLKIQGSSTESTLHRRQDGALIPVEVNSKYLRHEEIDYSLAVARDLTHVKRQEERLLLLREALEATPNAIAITDNIGSIQWTNPAFNQLTGYAQDEVNDLSFDEIIDPQQQDMSILSDIWQAIVSRNTWRGEISNIHRDGRRYQASITMTPVVDDSDEVTHYIAVIEDITERHKQITRLNLYATLFENTHEGVMVTDGRGIIQMVNQAFTKLTGYSESEAIGKRPDILKSGKHDHLFYEELWVSLRNSGHWQGEIWNRRKSGEIYPELLSISSVNDDQDELKYYVGVFSDISQLKQTEAELEYLAHHDPLTRLANRRLLMSQLEYGLKAAHRKQDRVALLVMDLDRFKDINDSYGHLIGDELLQLVAGRLNHRLRESDLVTRLGGDEFAVLMQGLDHPEDAALLASEIIQTLNEPCQLKDGLELQVGTSIGISLYPEHGATAETLLQHADSALYQAKKEGRGRFCYFSEELTRAARQRIEIHNNLRHALAENRLSVFYQPQIEFESGTIVGAEALLRWRDPELGNISPDLFIPVAEETGLISRIGDWVIREVCIQGKQWMEQNRPPLSLAVNLSVHQLRQGDFVEKVRNIVDETGYPTGQLSFEVTESAIMERETEALEVLNRLRKIGLHLSIDDFGTGYSSLAHLQRMPLDELKIDKTFIDDIPHKREDMEITSTIIAMARNLGLIVLAEGVETDAQYHFLQQQGCDFFQGYLISPPLDTEAFTRFMDLEPERLSGNGFRRWQPHDAEPSRS